MKAMKAHNPTTSEEIAFQVIMREARTLAGVPEDDDGYNWFTDEDGNTYIGSPAWQVSWDMRVAQLVETAYWIRYKENVRRTREELKNWVSKRRRSYEMSIL